METDMHPKGSEPQDVEVDVSAFAERGENVPHARTYLVSIDGQKVRVDTPTLKGEALLALVKKRPCAFELIAEFTHKENYVVEPGEDVGLRAHGLKGFITALKEIVTIFIGGDPYTIERGQRTVSEILAKVGKTPEGYILLQEKDGPPEPVPANLLVAITGCEVFYTQTQSGGSSHP